MPAARLPRWANRYPPRGFAPRSARRYTKPRGSPLLTTGTTSAVSLRGVSFARRLGVNIECRLTLRATISRRWPGRKLQGLHAPPAGASADADPLGQRTRRGTTRRQSISEGSRKRRRRRQSASMRCWKAPRTGSRPRGWRAPPPGSRRDSRRRAHISPGRLVDPIRLSKTSGHVRPGRGSAGGRFLRA